MSKPKKLIRHYSGKHSEKFWERVNALKPRDQSVCYAAGVLLQDMEGKVLTWIENAEAQKK